MSRTMRRRRIRKTRQKRELSGIGGYVSSYIIETYGSMEAYMEWAYSAFHRDKKDLVCVDYNKAPKEYRKVRNKNLRLTNRKELRSITITEDDVITTPFKRNAGWDYW